MGTVVTAQHAGFRVLDQHRRRAEWLRDLTGHAHLLLWLREKAGDGRSSS